MPLYGLVRKMSKNKEISFEISLKDNRITIIEKREREIFRPQHDGTLYFTIENDERYRSVEKIGDEYFHKVYNSDLNKVIEETKISEEDAIKLITERVKWLIEVDGI